MKKLLTVLFVLTMVLGLTACKKETKVDPNAKAEGVMTYAEYANAAIDAKVVVEGFVVASQSYYNGATLYVADGDGAYFVYGGSISEEDWNKLGITAGSPYVGLAKEGVKVHVEGTKAEWAGEVEIADAVVTIVDTTDKYLPEAKDVTKEDFAKFANQFVKMEATIAEAPIYKWDGSGEAGQNADLYYGVEVNGNKYTFVVESYLMYEGSELYNAVLALNAGDKVELQGFMYWYEGAQLHTTGVTKK